jgi:hypothetical protein
MRLSLLFPGALRYGYDEVFMEGLGPGILVRGANLAEQLAEIVEERGVTTRQYEELAGFLLAERAGMTERLYGARPDLLSRRRSLARTLGIPRDGAGSQRSLEVDLFTIVAECRRSLDDVRGVAAAA